MAVVAQPRRRGAPCKLGGAGESQCPAPAWPAGAYAGGCRPNDRLGFMGLGPGRGEGCRGEGGRSRPAVSLGRGRKTGPGCRALPASSAPSRPSQL